MKVYLVGGAVRDKLLELEIKERDWVVVGSTPEEMLVQGYQQVGKEFPVFLHPETKEEYALARKERKVAKGYTGFLFDFAPEVSLEEDLLRRDLTVNAIAQDEQGHLIDPYGGQEDLSKKQLRHVSTAFFEDPVRILRAARFAARFGDFEVAEDTIALMKTMVANGEVDALITERVWQEFQKALNEENCFRFFEVLDECDALNVLFPEVAACKTMCIDRLKQAASANALQHFVIISFCFESIKQVESFCQRLKVPSEMTQLAALSHRYFDQLASAVSLDEVALLGLLERLDVFRRASRFDKLLGCVNAIAGTLGREVELEWMLGLVQMLSDVKADPAVLKQLQGKAIAEHIHNERLAQAKIFLQQR